MKYKLTSIIAVLIFTTALVSHFADSTSANADKLLRTSETQALSQGVSHDLRYPLLPVDWLTVVNNGVAVPGSTQLFASYGQPSVNTNGVVVFRGRSVGSSERQSGIFKRESLSSPIEDVADLDILVPYPNNLDTKFTEFPSIPRISPNAANIATRGNHKPVYRYLLPDGSETRVGTNGIYVELDSDLLITGASKVGAAPGFESFSVPNTDPPLPFGVFPGSAAINDAGTIVFKGNYSIGDTERTGVFYRSLVNTPGGGGDHVKMIANSETLIPNLPSNSPKIRFGSTAPPSIVGNDVVFVGLDNEETPHYGGIFMASLTEPTGHAGHQLRTIANIGKYGSRTNSFSWVGEALSFDGRYVAFWGAADERTKTIRLDCPVDGNADLIAYCNGVDPNSVFDPETETWYQLKQVPINQGIYLYDRLAERTGLLSSTLSDFDDYVFWVYSGKVPGIGGDEEEDAEPPRWRGSAFMSVYDGIVAFKARTATLNPQGSYVNIVDGIYLRSTLPGAGLETVIETGMDGALIDPMLQPGEMPISALGIEREGLRGPHLAITVSMANAEEGWGGIYMAHVTAARPAGAIKATRK